MTSSRGHGATLMCEGDTVILECRSNPHVVDIRFAQLEKGKTVSIARSKVAHEMLIGQPFGTRFEVRGRDGIRPMTDRDGGITDEILGELGDAEAEGEEQGTSQQRDNRTLVDRNALTHGRECSQKLGAEEIKELKDQGKDTKDVMKALIENSDTFKQKTEFSQAKWLRKKAAKHAPQFTTARPSALSLCRAYFRKEPFKINHMREDTLARLLTLSNVQPGSRALVVDSMNGLVLGSLAERMGGIGRLMHGFNGLQPSLEALQWFNMDAEGLGVIFHFPLSELSFVPEDKEALRMVLGRSMVPAAADAPAKTKQMGADVDEAAAGTEMSSAVQAADAAVMASAPADDSAVVDARQRRIDGSKRVQQSRRPITPHAPTVEETQKELQEGFDSLVVAGSLDPKLLVLPLLRLVKPSSPIVIFSTTPYPLLELQEILIREEAAMNLHISESWMREHQVLPDRTHPLMQMSGSSAFLLAGTRVHKKSDRPPSRNASARESASLDSSKSESASLDSSKSTDDPGPAPKKAKT